MRALLDHLNFSVDEERLTCIASTRKNTFKRVVDSKEVVTPFDGSSELEQKMEEVVKEARRLLEIAGWHLPTHLYPEFKGK